MTRKNIRGSWKQNIKIILGAACVAIGIFYISHNPQMFSASILSLQQQSFIQQKWRDIAYKTNSWYIDIFLSQQQEIPTQVTFTLIFDDTTVSVDTQNITGQADRTTQRIDDQTLRITTIPSATIDNIQSLIMIPFTGGQKDILVSEAIASSKDNKHQRLSIGSLNEITNHTK